MGQCYSIDLIVSLKDEAGAVEALNKHIQEDTRTNYNLDKFKEQGVTPDFFVGLMKIFLAGWKRWEFIIEELDDGFTRYRNDFDASYGWESVISEMFYTLAPYLNDGSSVYVCPDSDAYEIVLEHGKLTEKAA